jgi:hypothetical protein
METDSSITKEAADALGAANTGMVNDALALLGLNGGRRRVPLSGRPMPAGSPADV